MLASALYIFPMLQPNHEFSFCVCQVCEGVVFRNWVPADNLHFALWLFPLSRASWQETFLRELFSALLKLVTDWSLVLSERSLRTGDWI